jgi:hypothetical protein
MKAHNLLPMAALAATLALYPGRARADDEEAELKEQPEAVQKTAHKEVGKLKIVEVEPSYEEGQHATEVEYMDGSQKMAIVIAKDGRLIQKEYRMSPADAPKAIVKGVTAVYSGGKITSIKKVERKGETFYEVEVKSGEKSHELKLDKAGKRMAISGPGVDFD